jgi:natural resistance-associated macrophage protein
VLLALTGVFVAYVVSGVLAHPDWTAAATGLVVPGMPPTREAVLISAATLGTTLAPWGLVFIQSYAVDKRLKIEDLGNERIDVIVGAVLTGGHRPVHSHRLRCHASPARHLDHGREATPPERSTPCCCSCSCPSCAAWRTTRP